VIGRSLLSFPGYIDMASGIETNDSQLSIRELPAHFIVRELSASPDSPRAAVGWVAGVAFVRRLDFREQRAQLSLLGFGQCVVHDGPLPAVQ
jgi:hypothetical protein